MGLGVLERRGDKGIWVEPQEHPPQPSSTPVGAPLIIHACPLFPAALLNKDKDSS